jgi:hypothetical protein
MSDQEINITQPLQSNNSELLTEKNLPNSAGILVLGIVSIALCWCYGIPGIILGIISLVLSGKAKKRYNTNPELYSKGSYKNMKAGRICSIIGLSLSALFIVYVLIIVFFFGLALGTASGSMPWDTYDYY